MVLTEYERSVLTELLSGVSENDLIQIAKTVSQKLIDIHTASRAVEVIILHSQTVESVLHRKKISKQLLFNYLNYKKIPIQSHLSKDEIIQRLLQYWKSHGQATPELTNKPDWEQQIPNSSQESIYNQEHQSVSYEQHQQIENYSPQQYNNYYVPQHYETSALVPQSQDIVSSQSKPVVQNQLDISNIDVQELAYEFTKWFNDRFNSCTYANGYQFDSIMFFNNANAEFKIIRSINNEESTENLVQVESNVQIGENIVQLQKAYNLYLHTNYDSLKVSKNSYGNIIIGVCGSLHSNSQLMGVYEQLFQLFNDPQCQLSDKPVWKIQKMLLNLKFVNNQRELESSSQEGQHSGMYEIEYEGMNSAVS